MRKGKQLVIFATIILLLVNNLSVYANTIEPGSVEDPVMTRSYLDRYLQEIFAPKIEQTAQINRQLNNIEEMLLRLESLVVPFTDIESHWAKENISYLYFKGIVGGVTDESFAPNDTVTRAQLAAMLVRAKGLNTQQMANVENPFNDLSESHWAYRDILAAREEGIVGGYADGSFRPNDNVSRAEIAAMITRAYSLSGTNEVAPFEDVAAGHWAAHNINLLVKSGVTTGYDDNTFRPQNNATRAEMATFLARTVDPDKRVTQ